MNNLVTASFRKVYTVCTCDPDDTIIANAASLKVGVARKVTCYEYPIYEHILDSVDICSC